MRRNVRIVWGGCGVSGARGHAVSRAIVGSSACCRCVTPVASGVDRRFQLWSKPLHAYAKARRLISAGSPSTSANPRDPPRDHIRQLSLEACQGGFTRAWKATPRPTEGAQNHHVALCLVAYVIVERERLDQGCTWRQLKRCLILQGRQLALPALERVRAAAQPLMIRGWHSSKPRPKPHNACCGRMRTRSRPGSGARDNSDRRVLKCPRHGLFPDSNHRQPTWQGLSLARPS